MDLPKDLIQFFNNNKQAALFVGAGISKSAEIPIASGIIKKLKELYPDRLKKRTDEYGYAEALKEALPKRGERRRFFEEICAGKPTQEEHHLIAHLVNHKKFSTVFTTNFDHLTELALTNLCSPQPRVYLYDVDIEPPEYSSATPKVLKLHGDFLFDDMANLDEELQLRLGKNMRSKLHCYLQGCGLLVVGYSGKDATVMDFLQELVEIPEGIKDGLWWVIYSEEERNNSNLIRLIDQTRSRGKPAEVIGPTDPVAFFTEICNSSGLDLPQTIPFSIKPKRNLITSYIQRFARARQLPPLSTPHVLDSAQAQILHRVKEALISDGVVWLFGPPGAGKSTVINKLAQEFDCRRVFFFSHRFAIRPTALSLRLDLEGFAGAFGIPALWYKKMISSLFKRNAVLIFDDLFSQHPPMHTHCTFFKEILQIIAIREQVGKGSIILISFSKPSRDVSDSIERAIFKQLTKIDMAVRFAVQNPALPRRSNRVWSLLSVMSLIRFAEYPDVLARLCDLRNVQTYLDELTENQLVETRGGKYVLRDSIQIGNANKRAKGLRAEIGQRFHALSAEQPFLRRYHYELEAENQFRQAELHREALLHFLTVAHLLTQFEGGYAGQSVFQHYVRVASISVLSTLKSEELLLLLWHYYQAAYQGVVSPDQRNAIERRIRQVLSERGKGYEYLLDASISEIERDFTACRRSLLKAEGAFREGLNYSGLALVLFKLSALAFETWKNVFYEKTKMELINEAETRAQEAESTYLIMGDQAGTARARDHLALVLLMRHEYERALVIENQTLQFHVEREGFTSEKGVVYGNLFVANLNLGEIKIAEGYFHQSNLNYAQRDEWEKVLINYFQLFQFSLNSNKDQSSSLPSAAAVYHIILESAVLRAASQEGAAVLQIAFETNRKWFAHNLRPPKVRILLIALKDFLRLSHLYLQSAEWQGGAKADLDLLERELAIQSLVKVAMIIKEAGKEVVQKIVSMIDKESPVYLNLYTCLCDWLLYPQANLDELLHQHKLSSEWKKHLEEVSRRLEKERTLA